ncbi:thioredoxin-like protein [Russula earlei]|uniref:Thioredoxin-like protein n=1 Tax=Russula earlei TaxID=71964 RepID=A0ACC0TYD6_9AGAM|nr:thioredoxin-like protein [Russula earlei]
MAFKLYGHPTTTRTLRVALVAKERNIPYEFVLVDIMTGQQKQAEHVEHNPFGLVPYIIQDDGFELFESRAIGRYLATLGSGPELIPTEPKAYAKFEQAASVEYDQFDPIAVELSNETIWRQIRGEPPNEGRVKELVSRLESKLDGYEVLLSKQKYLAGDDVTLADLFFLPYGRVIFERLGLGNLDKRPNVQRQALCRICMVRRLTCRCRWWKAISSRPAWQAVKDGI